jgi:hypothetical protein
MRSIQTIAARIRAKAGTAIFDSLLLVADATIKFTTAASCWPEEAYTASIIEAVINIVVKAMGLYPTSWRSTQMWKGVWRKKVAAEVALEMGIEIVQAPRNLRKDTEEFRRLKT